MIFDIAKITFKEMKKEIKNKEKYPIYPRCMIGSTVEFIKRNKYDKVYQTYQVTSVEVGTFGDVMIQLDKLDGLYNLTLFRVLQVYP